MPHQTPALVQRVHERTRDSCVFDCHASFKSFFLETRSNQERRGPEESGERRESDEHERNRVRSFTVSSFLLLTVSPFRQKKSNSFLKAQRAQCETRHSNSNNKGFKLHTLSSSSFVLDLEPPTHTFTHTHTAIRISDDERQRLVNVASSRTPMYSHVINHTILRREHHRCKDSFLIFLFFPFTPKPAVT